MLRRTPGPPAAAPVLYVGRPAAAPRQRLAGPARLQRGHVWQTWALRAEHFADDLEVSLEADMSEAFNVELEDDSAREARAPCRAHG